MEAKFAVAAVLLIGRRRFNVSVRDLFDPLATDAGVVLHWCRVGVTTASCLANGVFDAAVS